MKRLVLTIPVIILCVTCTTLPLRAQWLPRNFTADTSLRAEYLLGTQTLASYNNNILNTPNPLQLLRTDFKDNLFVLDGVAEVTPSRTPSLSGRARGSVSIFNPTKTIILPQGPGGTELSSPITPKFWFWEAAGLYNFYENIYRYSLVGGYRQDTWSYPSSNQGTSSYFQQSFVSQIPFIGLQTLMCCPTWKARFEILGSLFEARKVCFSARDQAATMQLDGNLSEGGFLELQAEGNVNISPVTWAGLYVQYTYESLRGQLTGVSPVATGTSYVPTPYNYYTLRNIWILGLNCNVHF
ncbi:MAG: hypothetical protein ACP5U1_13220 [Desulfomonilaceae bacterium]